MLLLSGVRSEAARAESASSCDGLESCRAAMAGGRYAAAEHGLARLSQPAARLLHARLMLRTGRYDEAAQAARRVSTVDRVRVAAFTLLGEALAMRGRLDAAQRAFESVVGDPSARRARVLLGRLLLRRGRAAEARLVLMSLVQAYNENVIGDRDASGLAYVAMAARMLGSPHDANDAFVASTRADAERVETQLEWAALYLEHEDTGHAEECVSAALRVDPHRPEAHVLMARIKLAQALDFVAAQQHLERALAHNPATVHAHVVRAGIRIRDMDLAAADRSLSRALRVDPTHLEALSVRAAVRFLADDAAGYRRVKGQVLALNPRYSRFFTTVADYANWEHRYPDIVEMAQEAIRIDPDDARAHATLGFNLLRMGDEARGLEALRESWRRDRFNVRVYNTLNLYDDQIGSHYEEVEAPPFVFRLHRDERRVMAPYLTRTLRQAYRSMVERYRFTPQGPIRIELFSRPDHFAVRTSGLPTMGVQGVCFGKVITAMSPRAAPFNWGQITWHELAHVFHIQLSRNRVPRWFTEGLAEYEAELARPEWKREEDHRLYLGLQRDAIPPLSRLNHAFTHARSQADVLVAYYASTKAVAYIVDRFGFPAVTAMLRGFGDGQTTETVVQRVLGLPLSQLSDDFIAYTRERLAPRASDFTVDMARYRDLEAAVSRTAREPDSAEAWATRAAAHLAREDADRGLQALRRALELDPLQATANFLAMEVALGESDVPKARRHLARLFARGHNGYEVRLLQARAALAQSAPNRARCALTKATRLDPNRPEAWQGLTQVARRLGDPELRLTALRRLVEVDQHDREASAALLDELARRDLWDEVLRYGAMSVFSDPLHGRSRRLLGDAYLRAGRPADALVELDAALVLSESAGGEDVPPVQLLRARALLALRRRAEAQAAATAAVQGNPDLAAAAEQAMRGVP